jgi:diguanylate cyclase (GGDEF)-like protein
VASGRRRTRTSWVIRDEFELTRFREMHGRLLRINNCVLVALLVALVPLMFVAPDGRSEAAAIGGILFFGVIQRVAHRFRRPEIWVLVGLLGGSAAIIGALSAYHAARSPAMALVAWPIAGLTGRYNNRVVAASLAWTIAVMELAIVGPDASVIRTAPVDVVIPPLAMIAVATSAAVLRDLDLASRGAAILDPLTGLLNRHALAGRVAELEHQSAVTAEPVGVIILDLDRFKGINDTFGHAVGDEVLSEVARRMRQALGAHDVAYRLGGEEFAVLLPARDGEATLHVAERLRAAVAAAPIAGLAVRASLGAASCARGTAFAWRDVFGRADAALYAAKRAGRDRVVLDAGAVSEDAGVDAPAPRRPFLDAA